MSDVTLVQTFPSHESDHLFQSVPMNIYPADSWRLKQTDSVSAVFLKECWVVMRNSVAVARIAIYQNPHLHIKNQVTCCLGSYECEENGETAQLLLTHACNRAKLLGASYVIGPMNGSTWENYRFSIDHDAAPFLLEPYHFLFYNDQFLQHGMEIIARYTSSFDQSLPSGTPELEELTQHFLALGVNIRSIDLARYEEELQKLYPLVTSAFETNFLYTPVEWEVFRDKYKEAIPLIDPKYVLIAEDETKHPIGFIFAYQNHYCTTERQLVVKTIARSYDKKWSGLGHVIANKVIAEAKANGCTALIHAFMIQDATSTAISRNFSGAVYKNYALYGKAI